MFDAWYLVPFIVDLAQDMFRNLLAGVVSHVALATPKQIKAISTKPFIRTLT